MVTEGLLGRVLQVTQARQQPLRQVFLGQEMSQQVFEMLAETGLSVADQLPVGQ
jgi:hypothetical protein